MKHLIRLTKLILLFSGIFLSSIFGRPPSGRTAKIQSRTSRYESAGKSGWKVGMQAWSLRTFTFFQMVDTIKNLGLHYMEANTGQKIGGGLDATIDPAMDGGLKRKVLDYLRSREVKLFSIGVNIPKTPAAWKQFFSFAESMGIQQIVSDPPPQDLPLVSQLCNQYHINVCIHDNPLSWRRSRNPDTVLADIQKINNPRIGACADIGNWVRAGFDPVKSLKKLRGHVMELHMKDLLGTAVNAEDTVWGSGNCNIAGVLKELHTQGFKGYFFIEYESHPGDNIPQIRKSLQYFYHTTQVFNK